MRRYICCRSLAITACLFRPISFCFCICVLMRSPINRLGSCTEINQRRNIQAVGASSHAAEIMMERLNTGEERKIKAFIPWTHAPLQKQAQEKKKKKDPQEENTREESFSRFCHHVAFTGLCFNVKDSAVSHVQLIRNQRLWLISGNESQKELFMPPSCWCHFDEWSYKNGKQWKANLKSRMWLARLPPLETRPPPATTHMTRRGKMKV